MTPDDELREQLTAAADREGRGADPDAARAVLQDTIAGAGGGAGSGLGTWLLPLLGVIGIIVGGVLGATVFAGDESETVAPADGGSGTPNGLRADLGDYVTYDCPGGAPTDRTLGAGDRVFVTGRDEAGDWVALRDPADLGRTLWLPTSAVALDAALDVDVIECDVDATTVVGETAPSSTSTTEPGATTSTTSTVPGETTTTGPPTTAPTTDAPTTVAPDEPSPSVPNPTTPPPAVTTPPNPGTTTTTTTTTTTLPPPPPDNQNPTIGQPSAAPEVISTNPCGSEAVTSTVTVIANDDTGVASVTGTHALGSFNLSGPAGGGTWTGTFGPFPAPAGSPPVTITLTARDAAGNSASTTITVRVFSCLN